MKACSWRFVPCIQSETLPRDEPRHRASVHIDCVRIFLTHPRMEQVNKQEHNAMSLAQEFSSLSPVHAICCGFRHKADKTEETAFVRSCAALQLLDHVLLTFNVCAESQKKNDRTVTPFVQSIGFLNKSRILFGEETRTHVCHAV